MIQSRNKNISPRDLFGEFSRVYSPKIDLSILKYLDRKKKQARHDFIRDIYSMLQEYCLRKGKRVRPLILLIAFGGYSKKKGDIAEIIKVASTLELMHSMLLVQDDIIDRSSVRRGGRALHLVLQERYGKVTLNGTIGSDIAIVAGDVLFSNAIEIISGLKLDPEIKNRFLALFSETYESTAWGQILDSLNTRPSAIEKGRSAALEISTLKTAYYTIHYPMLMGYVLSGGTGAAEKRRIADFALPLGLAFQIRDDILGVFGDREDTGKSADSDLIEGKLTILVENTLAGLEDSDRKKFLAVFKKEKKTAGDLSRLRTMIMESGALDVTAKKLRELTTESRKKIDALALSGEASNRLLGVIELIEERIY